MITIKIDETVALKVLDVVDAGLAYGLGEPVPGLMCVEAAVCYALGLPHGDSPKCVAPALRSLKIRLNDLRWSSNAARAKGLRRLALAQLGSMDALDEREFVRRLADLACRTIVPIALRAGASIHEDAGHRAALLEAANRCETSPNCESAEYARYVARSAYTYADASASFAAAVADAVVAVGDAYAVADAAAVGERVAEAAAAGVAAAAGRCALVVGDCDACDKILSDFAECVVQILIEMKAPGCQWLPLTEAD